MNSYYHMLEFDQIIETLKNYALTDGAKKRFDGLEPSMSQKELLVKTMETTEARKTLDVLGTPPLMAVKKIRELTDGALKGDMLTAEDLENILQFSVSCKRLKRFLERGKDHGLGISVYAGGIDGLELLEEEIERCIRGGKVDDHASKELKEIRRGLERTMEAIRQKLDTMLKGKKEYFSESFVSNRNGHFTLPVKKEYKLQVSGSVIDMSSTGATYFIEPTAVAKLTGEYSALQIEESNEERKILYTLSSLAGDFSADIFRNLDFIEMLDYMFAKGKLSAQMGGTAPVMQKERRIKIEEGRHPLISAESCVPLSVELGNGVQGIVITGPNTGGKTVALKTVGLFSLMAQCGLHVPCRTAQFCLNSQVLCDIGDGQSITENLSTFSAHIKHVIEIVDCIDENSLVLMDELGSGTDPAEGMGIAVSILEELKKSGCLFVATTHYPEVKGYASRSVGLINARMAFDKESLKPLYRLEMGEAGESCALYIAKRLGMPDYMLKRAYEETYGREASFAGYLPNHYSENSKNRQHKKTPGLKIKFMEPEKEGDESQNDGRQFVIGDCVMVYPDKKLGIIYQVSDEMGQVGVQIQKKKKMVNYKRLKLQASAADLYPEDYDFSIIFDTVENRKADRILGKRHQPGLQKIISEGDGQE